MLALIGVLVFLSVGCASTSVKYISYDTPAMLDWALNFDANYTVFFEPTGLAATGERLFVFGAFQTPTVTVRSFILLSQNGGKTFKEIGPPFHAGEVIDIVFPDATCGFALIGQTTAGPGELRLLRTTDSGKTWEILPIIPKGHSTGRLVRFSFTSPTHGEIVLAYTDENPQNLRQVLVTEDGGLTWQAFETKFDPSKPKTLIRPEPLMAKAAGVLYRLKETEQGWDLIAMGTEKPVRTFASEVQLSDVVGVEIEDCGCPSAGARNKMLQ
jgi:hypothetical protein